MCSFKKKKTLLRRNTNSLQSIFFVKEKFFELIPTWTSAENCEYIILTWAKVKLDINNNTWNANNISEL